MKWIDTLFFTMGMGFFIVGIAETLSYGIAQSYWLFMLSLIGLFLYGYRKNKHNTK